MDLRADIDLSTTDTVYPRQDESLLDVSAFTEGMFQIDPHDDSTAHVVEIQKSIDGFKWVSLSSPVSLTLANATSTLVNLRGVKFLRAAVTTVDSGDSEAALYMHFETT